MAIVTFLFTSEARISCSNFVSKSSVDLCFLKPHWVWLYPDVFSKCQFNLVLIIFSITLLAHERRDIGRQDSGFVRSFPCLGIGIISEFVQVFGILLVLQLLFIMPNSSCSLTIGRILRNMLCMSSSPVALLDGRDSILSVSSLRLNHELKSM